MDFAPYANWEAIAFVMAWGIGSIILAMIIEKHDEDKKVKKSSFQGLTFPHFGLYLFCKLVDYLFSKRRRR